MKGFIIKWLDAESPSEGTILQPHISSVPVFYPTMIGGTFYPSLEIAKDFHWYLARKYKGSRMSFVVLEVDIKIKGEITI